ncbi:M56 family metallopeptidase [Flavobacterium sp. GT3R68]|uniref:M56 family metallopeptidase n=1 Tax=Flavobacterium sp. GT3R68 TaxID=2594437 RepID=UPI0018F4EE87|nr:M56 family metallopeptidase [Flavobacterium sp. GT3R68]
METLFIYLIKSSGLVAMFFLAYYFLLRKETFFTTNRWFLMAGLVTSVILPLVELKKIIWVNPTPTNLDWTKVQGSAPVGNESFEINWYFVLAVVYAIGMITFLLKFVFDFYSLTKVLKNKSITQQADYKFIDVSENVSPFSYFNYIVYNSSLYSQSELENILEHEKVHSAQNHTIDVLILRFFCIAFWYNPFIWLYKKAILQNLEFIADSEASKNIDDKKAYQITLLKVTTHDNCVAITNHFYQSLIKKRIVMLNKNQSNKRNSWKYAIMLPILAAFVIFFQVKVIAQEKAMAKTETITVPQEIIQVVIKKNSTDAEMKNDAELLKKEHGITLKYSKIKRNAKGEITSIKMEYKDKNGSKGVWQIAGDDPIKPIQFYKDGDKIGFGSPSKMKIIHKKEDIGDSEDEDFELSFNGDDIAVLDAPEAPDAPDAPNAPDMTDAPSLPRHAAAPGAPHGLMEKNRVIRHPRTPGKPVIIVNGKKMDVDVADFSDEDEEQIESMNVMRSRKTGDDDDMVIEIVTKDRKEMTKLGSKVRKVEMEKAKKEIRKAQMEMDASRPEMEKAIEEMVKAKVEMEKAKIELEQAKEELKKQK